MVAGGGVVAMEKWSALAVLDIAGSSGFGYGFCARRGGASINGGGDAGGKYGLELADSYNTTILDMGVHRTEWKIRHEWQRGRIARNLALFLLAKLTITTEV